MFTTLYAKLTAALIIILISVGLLFTILNVSTIKHYTQEAGQTLNYDLARNLVMDRNLVQSGKLNEAAVKATFMEYMTINPSIELYLLDLDGRILSYSADPGKVKRQRVSLVPIKAFLGGDKPPLLGDDPRSLERQKVFSVTPVPNTAHPEGYLYVVLLGEKYDAVGQMIKDSLVWQQSLWALAISLLFALLVGLFLFRFLTLRLRKLNQKVSAFHNEFDNQITNNNRVVKKDEIETLSLVFEQMSARINEQLDALKVKDNLRRELVANVSHDLRTPIAVLHGYLETLKLKGTDLNSENRDIYINQALKSSDRLQQLINELFELAHLDAQEHIPELEQLNMAELSHDIVQKFELQAQKKSVRLEFNINSDHGLINGDIRLISRLLENLISNAIKFSPDNDTIILTCDRKDEQLVFSIHNNGPAIAASDLPHVFERFFTAHRQGDKSQQPGGLGLAIANRIVELHHGHIAVSSNDTDGTYFTVSLPTTA